MLTAGKEAPLRVRKSIACGLAIFIIAMAASCRPNEKRTAEKEVLEGDVSISTCFALYPLMVKLGDEFHKVHPGLRFDVSAAGAAKSVSDTLNRLVDLGGISREVHPQEKERGLWSAPVARDAVLAIVSEDNPYLHELLRQGAGKGALAGLWIEGGVITWGDLTGDRSASQPIHAYTRADLCGAGEIWAQFLGGQQENLKGLGVHGDSWMAGAVKKDPLGIGYANLNFAYDARTLAPVRGIRILPIDINGNGRIDPEEDFYSTRTQVLEAIASQGYPSPPSRDLYLISRGLPQRKCVREFLIWVLTQGQSHVSETGYIPLPEAVLMEARRDLTGR
jgi:phosphate transport system substrate-binding protein